MLGLIIPLYHLREHPALCNKTHLESKSLPLPHQGHSFAFYKLLCFKTKNTFPHIFQIPLSVRAFKQALLVPLAGHVVEGKSFLPLHMAVFRAHTWNSSVVIQHSKTRDKEIKPKFERISANQIKQQEKWVSTYTLLLHPASPSCRRTPAQKDLDRN